MEAVCPSENNCVEIILLCVRVCVFYTCVKMC